MRAISVPIKIAYCFDFDDTLVKTDARTHVYKNKRRVKSLNARELETYKVKPDETLNLDDFYDPRFIINASKYKMWNQLERVDIAKKSGHDLDIYILTARGPQIRQSIHNFISKNGVDIPIENINTVGSEDRVFFDIAPKKKSVLFDLSKKYDEVYFFDDSESNIAIATGIPGINTRLVEEEYDI